MRSEHKIMFRFNEVAKAKEFADVMAQISSHKMDPEISKSGKEVSVNIGPGQMKSVQKAANDLGGYLPGKPTLF